MSQRTLEIMAGDEVGKRFRGEDFDVPLSEDDIANVRPNELEDVTEELEDITEEIRLETLRELLGRIRRNAEINKIRITLVEWLLEIRERRRCN